MTTRSAFSRFLAVCAVLLAAGCQTEQANPYIGQNLYLGYCAACHGPVGAGDGPIAPNLNIAVTDLRTLAARNGGTFPRQALRDVIDGRQLRAGHGSQDMPVWGWDFRRDEGDTAEGIRNVQLRVEALVDHIETLQTTR